jgi:hypothetical protein
MDTRFDPPLILRGGRRIADLYQAERFIHAHGAEHGSDWEAVLRMLQGAADTKACEVAADAFIAWTEATGLLERNAEDLSPETAKPSQRPL